MGNIMVKREGGELPALPTIGREWEPLRMFRDLVGWDPFQEMAPLWKQLPRELAFTPEFDVKETKEAYLFTADVPGLKEKDLDISVTGTRLTVSGKRERETEEKTDTYYTCERSYGSFTRSFTMPEGVDTDHIHAELKAGVLYLNVPKKPEVQPKKVEVKVAGPKV